ncbi:MAG: FAD-binding oxidoreductase [Steroidobacteraceae bacterium]|jgi:glycine/D-amino acid oxidase-like deaminating enzyme|nr:FAD-binding oxidoreductase [Steroidobacteraceae bacterium]
MADVIVIGGGLTGCATAYYLAADGVPVTLLEQGDLNTQASGSNAGSLHLQIPSEPFRLLGDHWARAFSPALRLFTGSLEMWRGLSAELGTDLEVKLRGGLLVAATDEELALLERKAAIERSGGADVQVIGRDELRALAPYLSERMIGAAFCPVEGKANPLVAAPAYAAAAARLGAEVRRGVRVTGLRRERGAYVVATDTGELRARRVVNAAGAAAGEVAGWLGVRLEMRAASIQVSVTEAIEPLVPHLVYSAGRKLTLKQNGLGQLLIGGGWPARIDARGRPVADPDTLAQNLGVALEVVPRIGPVQVLRTWAAYVNGTDDWRPLIGEVPGLPGFFLCYVPWLGFTGGPAAARIVASQLQGRAPALDVDAGAFAVAA